KLSLANLILNFKPLVSPSTFLLDVKGQPAKPDTAENLATTRHLGLGPDAEFCPLPAALRASGSELFARFAARYTDYVERVVKPTVLGVRWCRAVVVLIDVTMLLAGGVGMYDDNRQILRDLLDVLSPGEHPMFGPIGRALGKVFLPHQWRPGWITRIAFAAPKMDLVHPADRDRMLSLMRRMVEKYADNRDGLKYQFFNLSSIVSTKVLTGDEGERVLVGVPLRDAEGRKLPPGPEQRFVVSELPDDWPLDWKPGRYSFPEVYPRMPTRK